MAKGKAIGMQTESAYWVMSISIILHIAAIFEVTYNWMVKILHVYTYLVLASCVEFEFHERISILALERAVVGDSIFAAIVVDA